MQVEGTPVMDLLEVFGGDFTPGSEALVQVEQARRKQTEEQSETNDDCIADGFIERWLPSKEGFLAAVLEKGWVDVVLYERHVACFGQSRKK